MVKKFLKKEKMAIHSEKKSIFSHSFWLIICFAMSILSLLGENLNTFPFVFLQKSTSLFSFSAMSIFTICYLLPFFIEKNKDDKLLCHLKHVFNYLLIISPFVFISSIADRGGDIPLLINHLQIILCVVFFCYGLYLFFGHAYFIVITLLVAGLPLVNYLFYEFFHQYQSETFLGLSPFGKLSQLESTTSPSVITFFVIYVLLGASFGFISTKFSFSKSQKTS